MPNENQVGPGEGRDREATSDQTLDEIEENESEASSAGSADAAPSPDGEPDTPRESPTADAGPM